MKLLSIIIPLYNQEKYLAQALDSIFAQKTKYEYKVIIADDASSDNSLKIAKEYQSRHKNIQILESKTNQKLYDNILRVYRALDSKYFCVLDPDDFWVDSNIIESALDFLESNENFSIYCFNTKVVSNMNGEINERNYIWCDTPKESEFRDFLESCAIMGHTSASFYRNVVFGKNMPKNMLNLKSNTAAASFRGDSFRNIVHLQKGKLHYDPRVVSVYRVHDKGIWQSLDKISQLILSIDFYIDMWEFYEKKYAEFLKYGFMHYNEIFELESFSILLFNAMLDNASYLKMQDILLHLQRAHNVFKSNMQIIESTDKIITPQRVKLKYRVLKNIYLKLDKKLTRKGLVQKITENKFMLKDMFDKSAYFSANTNEGGGGVDMLYFAKMLQDYYLQNIFWYYFLRIA